MNKQMIYSFVVRDVSVAMDENNIKSDLMKRYDGVAAVTRMFFDDEETDPKTSIQVDITLRDVAEKIERDGIIVIGGICRRAYSTRNQRDNQKPRRNWENTTTPLGEQDLINMFEEQKKLLTNVLNYFDDKLNSAITLRQDKIAQPVLSNNAR